MSKTSDKKAEEENSHDPFQDMLFREIEEDLRMEKLKKIWDKYSIVVFAAMLIVVGAVGGKHALRSWDTYIRTSDSNIYLNAAKALRNGDKDLAIKELQRLEHSAKTNYDEIAAYKQALLSAENGDYKRIDAIAISKNSFKDIAAVTSAMYKINAAINANKTNTEEYKTALKSLEVYKGTASPWRGTALEMTAVAALHDGDIAKAKMNLEAINNDEHLSIKLKERAAEMIATLPEEKTKQAAKPAA